MIEVNKNTLASTLPALGKLICRTSPLMLCKSIKIESEDKKLKFSTCGLNEEVSYELKTESSDVFSCIVGFDEFRDAVRGGRNKTVCLNYEAGTLLVGDRYLMTVKDVEWPDFTPHAEVKTCELPEGVVGMFARAAQVIDRSGARAILRGINLSSDGIAATNGKELVNYDLSLNLEDNLTIPLPLALIQSKASEAGTISYWQNGADYRFRIQLGMWSWIGKTISGMYPNWKQIIPKSDALTHEIKISEEQSGIALDFLKTVPDKLPYTPIELKKAADNRLILHADADLEIRLDAELNGDWNEFSLMLNKNILFRLFSEKHTRIQLSSSHVPILATGGLGRYIAMPLYTPKTQEIQPKQEENKMENTEMKVVSVPIQTAAPKQETENQNPLDDLSVALEAFKAKMKASFDEVASLARKVKEAQIMQRQKERDFVQARRAIERIRLASGF